MKPTPAAIASQWREQMQKGYLKLAILFALTKGPSHGYQIMKKINELTLGVIKPTPGGIYPTLKELEENQLAKSELHPKERRKVYQITDKGRAVFKEMVEKQLDLVSSVRSWILKALIDLKIIKNTSTIPFLMPSVRLLLLNEGASTKEKIEALEKLRAEIQNLSLMLNTMTKHIDERITELKTAN